MVKNISNASIQIQEFEHWVDFQSVRPITREGAMALLKTVRHRHPEETFRLVLEDWNACETEIIKE